MGDRDDCVGTVARTVGSFPVTCKKSLSFAMLRLTVGPMQPSLE
jgi:hypothetical protein